MLEFYNNLWGIGPSRNRVVVLASQATYPGGIVSLESIPGLQKSLKIRARGERRNLVNGYGGSITKKSVMNFIKDYLK